MIEHVPPARPARAERLGRDWPMLVGMAIAVAMLIASARIGAASPPNPTPTVESSSALSQYELALQPGGPQPSQGGARASSGPVTVTGARASARLGAGTAIVSGTSHAPMVGRPWRFDVTLADGSRPAGGRVELDMTYRGLVVGRLGSHPLTRGRYRLQLRWPAAAAGQPLTLRARITSGATAATFLFPVEARS